MNYLRRQAQAGAEDVVLHAQHAIQQTQPPPIPAGMSAETAAQLRAFHERLQTQAASHLQNAANIGAAKIRNAGNNI